MTGAARRMIIGSGRFLRLVTDDRWEYVERVSACGVVAVLAVTEDGSLVLTEQYRPPVRAQVIDLPAGLAGDVVGQEDEPLEMAACRELEEETGFTATRFRRLATLPTSPGLSSEQCVLFAAETVTRCGDGGGGGDGSEQITVHVVPLQRIAGWLEEQTRRGCLVDPKVYGALWWLAERSTSEGD